MQRSLTTLYIWFTAFLLPTTAASMEATSSTWLSVHIWMPGVGMGTGRSLQQQQQQQQAAHSAGGQLLQTGDCLYDGSIFWTAAGHRFTHPCTVIALFDNSGPKKALGRQTAGSSVGCTRLH